MPDNSKTATCRGCEWQTVDYGAPDLMWFICMHPSVTADEGRVLSPDFERPDDCPLLTEGATNE